MEDDGPGPPVSVMVFRGSRPPRHALFSPSFVQRSFVAFGGRGHTYVFVALFASRAFEEDISAEYSWRFLEVLGLKRLFPNRYMRYLEALAPDIGFDELGPGTFSLAIACKTSVGRWERVNMCDIMLLRTLGVRCLHWRLYSGFVDTGCCPSVPTTTLGDALLHPPTAS